MPYTILHTESSLGWGGQEIRIFQEMQAMQDRGHRVFLASPPQSRLTQEAKKAGIQVWTFSPARFEFPASIARLALVFRREKVQVINTHSSRDSYIAGIAARIARVPLLIRSRHIDVEYPNISISRLAYSVLPHAITTTSDRISQKLIKTFNLSPERVITIPTGIDLSQFRPTDASALRSELLLPGKSELCGIIAVLRSWKGHRVLFEAASKLVQLNPKWQLVVVGDGPLRNQLTSEIEKLDLTAHIKLVGHRNDIPMVLNALDCVVLPSLRHEGIPQAILQAHACGIPVIGTSVGGIPEVIEEDQTGYLVDPNDSHALIEGFQEMWRDPEKATSMARAAQQQAQKNYGLNTMCEKTENVIAHFFEHNSH